MPTIVAATVVTFEAIDVAVFVTTLWTPPMSFEIRDCTSPVRVRVKNASESRCRWRKTAARRSCITRWPTWFERSVWITPSTPVTTAIAIIPPAFRDRAPCRSGPGSPGGRAGAGTPGSRRAPAEKTISASSRAQPALVGREQGADPPQVRAAHGRVGRTLGPALDEWKNMPIELRVRRGA